MMRRSPGPHACSCLQQTSIVMVCMWWTKERTCTWWSGVLCLTPSARTSLKCLTSCLYLKDWSVASVVYCILMGFSLTCLMLSGLHEVLVLLYQCRIDFTLNIEGIPFLFVAASVELSKNVNQSWQPAFWGKKSEPTKGYQKIVFGYLDSTKQPANFRNWFRQWGNRQTVRYNDNGENEWEELVCFS